MVTNYTEQLALPLKIQCNSYTSNNNKMWSTPTGQHQQELQDAFLSFPKHNFLVLEILLVFQQNTLEVAVYACEYNL